MPADSNPIIFMTISSSLREVRACLSHDRTVKVWNLPPSLSTNMNTHLAVLLRKKLFRSHTAFIVFYAFVRVHSSLVPLALLASSLFFCVGFGSCKTTDNAGTVKAVESILNDVRAQTASIQKAQEDLGIVQSNLTAHVEGVSQKVADHVDGARFVNRRNAQTNAFTAVVETELDVAARSLPPPSPQSQEQIIEKLRLALSTNEVDRAKLAELYDLQRTEAEKLRAETGELKQEVKTKEVALGQATQELTNKVALLADVEAKARINAAQAEEARKIAAAERASKVRMRVAGGFMAFGGLLIVAGIVAAYLHVSGVLLPALCAGVGAFLFGWLISYVEGLMQNVWFKIGVGAVLLGGLGLLAWLAYRSTQTRRQSRLDEQISNSTIGAIQELRNDDDRFGLKRFDETLKPYLEAWHTTADGYPHPEVRREIDKRLIKMNLRDAGKKTAAIARMRTAPLQGADAPSPRITTPTLAPEESLAGATSAGTKAPIGK